MRHSILGIAARFSSAVSVSQFWNVLLQGGTLMGQPSAARQALLRAGRRAHWQDDRPPRGHFLEDIDAFDRRLFCFSPSALTFADPRQRLLLEAVWNAIEDAGLQRAELAGRSVGVFVAHDGWYLDAYVRRIPPALRDNQEFIVPGNDPCFLANRISSTFDFRGPSLAFDSTCSGTYVAVHNACRALEHGECDIAIVAAVSLFLDPWADGMPTATPFETALPEMRSYTSQADGYCTSEGCGAIVLQRSSPELDARHAVHAHVCASGCNSGGKTNSFAQPSQRQQAELFRSVIERAQLQPSDIAYVEAHGVATQVGDAVEAQALVEVLQRREGEPPCFISTIKPNLGHNHASSGIYSLLKAIQALQHGKIAPIRGLAGAALNPGLPADMCGLQFLQQAQAWPEGYAQRRALLCSYGLSNVNAALVLEAPGVPAVAPADPAPRHLSLVCLSAQSEGQLLQQVQALRALTESWAALGSGLARPACDDVAYTLQVGREAMPYRWAAVVDGMRTLGDVLRTYDVTCSKQGLDWTDHGIGCLQVGNTLNAGGEALLAEARQAAVDQAIATRKWADIAALWCDGAVIDWPRLYRTLPRRVHLPTYPFLRERYWVTSAGGAAEAVPVTDDGRGALSLRCTGEEFFLADHVIGGQRLLPGVMHLELLRRALAVPQPGDDGPPCRLSLRHMVWAAPLTVDGAAVDIELGWQTGTDGQRRFEIASQRGAQRVVHSQGLAPLPAALAVPQVDLALLRARMARPPIGQQAIYTYPDRMALHLGPRLRGIEEVLVGDHEILATLALPGAMAGTLGDFGLHPSLADPILQVAYLGLVMPLNEGISLTIPFALEHLELHGPTRARMWTWVRYAAGSRPGDAVQKLDVDLCDEAGRVCLVLRDFSFRARVAATAVATAPVTPQAKAPTPAEDRVVALLRRELAGVLNVPLAELRADEPFAVHGIDSVMVVRLTNHLEHSFGALPKTLFFEHQSLRALACHFQRQHGAALSRLLQEPVAPAACAVSVTPVPAAAEAPRTRPAGTALDIAIVGLSGRYPQARNLQQFWQNLASGADCITEVPASRWDWRDYYSEDRAQPGRHYSKWGGFIDGIESFDAQLFNIAPREAELLDPQERLFLEQAWAALEDAGYSRTALRAVPGTGVYAGVMYGQYQLFGAEAGQRGQRVGFASTLASVANRVSYTLDLHGPSMTVDTMCSSSLSAIHLACQDLRLGHTDVAIAGGVNLTLHPAKYLELSRRQFISSKGRCESFGVGGDGYIPGEGVGVAILKRLEDAERDGDHIYGVIAGSALNHGGKTNGYTVPNPAAQQAAVLSALQRAGIDAADVGYVEAHGTGTQLGDPIEIAGLSQAYAAASRKPLPAQRCWLGSVKSNIGHAESAAGIAGLSKLLLQMQHGQITPSLHSATLNPHIDFTATPFRVPQALQDWPRPAADGGAPRPRVAAISSFGAGGANAHLVVREHLPVHAAQGTGDAGPALVPLSAASAAQLQALVRQLLQWLQQPGAARPALADLAYTLQVGREAMTERLAVCCTSLADLAQKLEAHLGGAAHVPGLHSGRVLGGGLLDSLNSGELAPVLSGWLRDGQQDKVLELWVQGLAFDWTSLHGAQRPRRVSLPTYPFKPTRHWLPAAWLAGPAVASSDPARWHALVHRNVSTLAGLAYESSFDADDAVVRDHVVQGARLLPAAAGLEMVRAAAAAACAEPGAAAVAVQLCDVAWLRPLAFEAGATRVQVLLDALDSLALAFRLLRVDADGMQLCAQGRVLLAEPAAAQGLDLAALQAGLSPDALDADACYRQLATAGLVYGPSYRCLQQVRTGRGQVLARLQAGPGFGMAEQACLLHPGVLDAALQASAWLDAAVPAARVPYTLERIEILSPCVPAMWAWVRAAGAQQVDIDIADDDGRVCVRLRGLATRPLAGQAAEAAADTWMATTLMATTQWVRLAPPLQAAPLAGLQQQVLLCELPQFDVQALAAGMPAAAWIVLHDDGQPVAARFQTHAVRVLAQAQGLLARPSGTAALLQLVVPHSGDAALMAGLGALLHSAQREHAGLVGQLVVVDAGTTPAQLIERLRAEAAGPQHARIRHVHGQSWQGASWQYLPVAAMAAPAPWRQGGVYLITGGLGGLGPLFAQAMLRSDSACHVVLCGRSVADAQRLLQLQALAANGSVSYQRADLGDAHAVQALVQAVLQRHGALHGVLHAAGVLADSRLADKDATTFAHVLRPKVAGVVHLDAATAALDLDFFVTFSSAAGALGNAGQADYAAANAFMDGFMERRAAQVQAGARQGRSLSIAWPLWQDGGMGDTPVLQARLQREIGMQALPAAAGLQAFQQALAADAAHLLVLHGDAARLRAWVDAPPAWPQPAVQAVATAAPVVSEDRLHAAARELLCDVLSDCLKVPRASVAPDVPFATYGIDSVSVLEMTAALELVLGRLEKTLFYEHRDISALAAHLAAGHADRLATRLPAVAPAATTPLPVTPLRRPAPTARLLPRPAPAARTTPALDIAIIGISGRYPGARELGDFWTQLRNGQGAISEVPPGRWDWRAHSGDGPGAHTSRWGGFIDGVDEFDAGFFGIPANEAALMDPQERLFLQHAWAAVEDAGHDWQTLDGEASGRAVGVYVGAMYGEYQLFGTEPAARALGLGMTGSLAGIANRVSHLLNLHGPSLTLDSMCSSSLTAIHLACQDLRDGRTGLAIAGGVSLSLHPGKYTTLSAKGLVAPAAQQQAFGAGGHGYIPGEAVGAVLLKRLEDAERDGDVIHAVIKGSAINHGGRGHGYHVPSPQAQRAAITGALQQAGVSPRAVSCIEAHGTGTLLGDPIEVAALAKAFRSATPDCGYCAIGSLKSNIGHAEAAAGMASLTKVLLQLRHRTLAPTLLDGPGNPNIDFAATPFRVVREAGPWQAPLMDGVAAPRVAGISAFGAGGANAHLVVAEYVAPAHPADLEGEDGPVAVVLSARTPAALWRSAARLLAVVEAPGDGPAPTLRQLAYVLQTGREAMAERLGLVVASRAELVARLRDVVRQEEGAASVFRGCALTALAGGAWQPLAADEDMQGAVQAWLSTRRYAQVLALWVQGLQVDWQAHYAGAAPRRCSLPSYPFARDRHWWDSVATAAPAPAPAAASAPQRAPAGFAEVATMAGTASDKLMAFLAVVLGNVLDAEGPAIGADTPLAALHLGSLHVVRSVEILQAAFGDSVPVTAFYECDTVGQLRDRLADRLSLEAEDIVRAALTLSATPPADAGTRFALTDMQQAFVIGRELPTFGQRVGSTVYFELQAAGDIDEGRLGDAWQRLLQHHEALRIRITEDLQQDIEPTVPRTPIAVLDLAALQPAQRDAQRAALRREMSEQVWALSQWPYFDLRVSRSTGGDMVHVAIDELLVDGYSAQLLARQLVQLVQDPAAVLPALACSYRDHLRHGASLPCTPGHAEGMAYWQRKLAGMPPAPQLACAASSSAAAKVHTLQGRLDAAPWARIQQAAARLRCYPSAALLAAFVDTLRQHTGQPAFSLTLTHMNRLAVHRDVMSLAGLFIHSNVFIADTGPGSSFEARLLQTQAQLNADAPHAHIGARPALQALRQAGTAAGAAMPPMVFTSLVGSAFQGLPAGSGWKTGAAINTTPQVHLDHQLLEDDGALVWRWYVADALHAQADVHALFQDFGARLQRIADAAEDWSVADDEPPFPLTNQQVAYAFGRGSSFRHGGKGCVFHAEYDIDALDLPRLARGWNRVLRLHPMLHTTVRSDGTQQVSRSVADTVIADAAPSASQQAFEQACASTRQAMLATVFPLDSDRFFALAVCRHPDGTGRLFINIDLLVADGPSLMTIVGQLFQVYQQADAPLSAGGTSFRAHVLQRQAARDSAAYARDAAYWRHKFESLPSGPAFARDAGAAPTRQLSRRVPLQAGLHRAAEVQGCGLGALLLAAYGQTLLDWNGGQPLAVVTVHWDRDPARPELQGVVGDFTRLGWVSFAPGAVDAADCLARTRRQLEADAAHPAADGLEALRRTRGLAFPVVFTDLVPGGRAAAPSQPGVRQVYAVSHTPQVTLDSIGTVLGDDELLLQWDTSIGDESQAAAMFERYVERLQAWAAEWAAAPAALPAPVAADQGACLHHAIERTAALHPQQLAVRAGERSISYAELERRSAHCARWLRRQGVGADSVVAVLMERSIEMVVALVAVLRAGAAYLPLDTKFPRGRNELILQDAGVRCILTQDMFAAAWRAQFAVFCPQGAEDVEEADADVTLPADVGPAHLAYVIYTSGSTGRPKGCMIEHRAIVNRLQWMQRQFPLAVGDVVLQKTPYTFDVSVWEFFWPLMQGASIVMARPQGHLDSHYLLELIRDERVTVCHFVPSMLRTVLQENNLARLAGLRHVMVSGEELEYDLLEEYLAKVPVPLENLYGPTEAAVDVSHWHCELNPQRRSSIGRAITGIHLHVLDEQLRPVPQGSVGELYIAGIGVGRGYLNNPALSARSFLQSPFHAGERMYKTGDLASEAADGNISYHGRADTQVKLNGLRIELEEVEHQLRLYPQVQDAIVAVQEFRGTNALAAHVVLRQGGTLPADLRDFLAARLPVYMVPHAVSVIAAVPLTTHGKRSRKELPPPQPWPVAAPATRRPAPDVQTKLRQMLHTLTQAAAAAPE